MSINKGNLFQQIRLCFSYSINILFPESNMLLCITCKNLAKLNVYEMTAVVPPINALSLLNTLSILHEINFPDLLLSSKIWTMRKIVKMTKYIFFNLSVFITHVFSNCR